MQIMVDQYLTEAFDWAKRKAWDHAVISLRSALSEANRAKSKQQAGKIIRAIQCCKQAMKTA